jgi:uracil-DNA glycosylase family 4
MSNHFEKLENLIVSCKKCPRLVSFRKKIAKEKRKQYINEKYWGKPITGFGDPKARILFVGLAPAAHGGNRTGRVFTGDRSSDFLYKCLYKAKLSNQPNSDHRNDGLKLKDIFITTALKCVPPGDKPTKKELNTCFKYFNEEIEYLENLKIVVALGKIAFDACLEFYKKHHKIDTNVKFGHSKFFKLPNNILLVGSYHPSPRNVNTGRINVNKMTNLFVKIKNTI